MSDLSEGAFALLIGFIILVCILSPMAFIAKIEKNNNEAKIQIAKIQASYCGAEEELTAETNQREVAE